MKKQLNEIKRLQQLAGVIKESQFNGGTTSYTQWKPALVSFIQSNLTDDIGELDMLNDVLREIIADNEQELADPNNQDYLSENVNFNKWAHNKTHGVDIVFKLSPANPNGILMDEEEGEEITKEDFWETDIKTYNRVPQGLYDSGGVIYAGKEPNGTWEFSWDSGIFSGFVEGEDFEFVPEEEL